MRSTERILATHVGSLPRSHDLVDLIWAKSDDEPYDEALLDARVETISFQAANPTHAYEWQIVQDVKLPRTRS